MKRIPFSVPDAMNDALHDCAESEGKALSAVIREAVEQYLTQRNYAVSGRVTAGGDRRKPARPKTVAEPVTGDWQGKSVPKPGKQNSARAENEE